MGSRDKGSSKDDNDPRWNLGQQMNKGRGKRSSFHRSWPRDMREVESKQEKKEYWVFS
jgi:hypothetical protein